MGSIISAAWYQVSSEVSSEGSVAAVIDVSAGMLDEESVKKLDEIDQPIYHG
jgi:hypothetical protein